MKARIKERDGKERKMGQEYEKGEVVANVSAPTNANLYLEEWFLTRGGFQLPCNLPD